MVKTSKSIPKEILMKTNFTLILKSVTIAILLLLVGSMAFSQPDYIFKNAVLESGTDLQVGAKYRFSNVKPGIDGILTIADMKFVTLNQLDGPSGFEDAFQPYINCPAKKKGYVEFDLDFVIGGTKIPAVMVEVPMTAIDVDGYEFPDEKLYEFDEFKLSPTYFVNFDFLGTNLDVKFTGGPLGWVSATNTSAITYDGIDTLQKDVMFTMVHAAVSSVTFRVGADNKSATDMLRLRSVYFMKFVYPGSIVLPLADLISFDGNNKNGVVQLNWNIARENNLESIMLEKSTTGSQFEPLTNYTTASQTHFSYQDQLKAAIVYYRLKLRAANGQITYSNIIVFRSDEAATRFNVYPAIATDYFSVNINAEKRQQGSLRLFDYSGRMVYQKQISVEAGINTMMVNDYNSTLKGNFLVVTQLDHKIYKSKIIIN